MILKIKTVLLKLRKLWAIGIGEGLIKDSPWLAAYKVTFPSNRLLLMVIQMYSYFMEYCLCSYFILRYLYISEKLISIKIDYDKHCVPLGFFGKKHLLEFLLYPNN